jgi:hypothetical protein
MFSLYNIVSDILYSVVVRVDFLGTHMTNLVLFLKPSVTWCSIDRSSIGYEGHTVAPCEVNEQASFNGEDFGVLMSKESTLHLYMCAAIFVYS